MRRSIVWLAIAALSATFTGWADPPAGSSRATYLANAGVMIERGDVKILFDPLFRNGYGQYQLVDAETEEALFNGEPPWDGIDAVFVSHHHGDHFSAEVMSRFLDRRRDIHFYGPTQAVAAMVLAGFQLSTYNEERLHSIELDVGSPPVRLLNEEIIVDAVRIPHSGWPTQLRDVENIAFRVTLDNATTVLHLGDADDNPEHFTKHANHWRERHTDLALPPYWFFMSPQGREILDKHIEPTHSVGVHVPAKPELRPDSLVNYDVFTTPGETREIGNAPQ